jgi:hypothetical protein
MVDKSGIRTVLIDDESYMLKLLAHQLGSLGYAILTTHTKGSDALNLDSSVERARVGYWRRVWVGVTTLQATACKEEQHPQTCCQ